jgi:CHAD domain-containing protein
MTHVEGSRPGEASVGMVLQRHLVQQVAALRKQESRVRQDDEEGVHKMRIAVRRLRSALATYRSALRPGSSEQLRSELRWLGGELSPARDAQVMAERLETLLREQPTELVLGPVGNRIHTEMSAQYLAGRRRALESLDSERYRELLDALDAFVASPPFDEAACQAAGDGLPRMLRRDLARVHRRAAAVAAANDPGQRDVALHETRKAAKRLRYAAESAAPALGARAEKLATRAQRVQEVLGEHQDTVVARQTLRELGAKAFLEHENGFTFGRLHALEEARAEELYRRFPEVVARLPSRRRLKPWLKR